MSLYSQATDSELTFLLQEGREAAFDEIYKRHWKKLYNEAFRRLHDAGLCEEVVQDVFIDLWNKRAQREIENLLPYLLTTVKYQVFALYKKNKALPYFEEPLEHMAVSSLHSDSRCFEEELIAAVNSWLSLQPEGRRKIFRMRYLEGMPTKEIASELNISHKTVQNQLHSSKGSLKLSISKLFFTFLCYCLTVSN
ncbi:RNA polymerase sigma factor [Dyadobacter sp. CY323]|uniref:RNA polymerase sigma factor n=1 Tax=Dyadobacter sp. CY323 TaxID=2907302 RepID=UPI001F248243|nr:sigma-70 family RNA polymerase sigma factor [Dyadobacter sp. CY323]MCE6992464.1 sigma-70 family RNA polymerase sigma factor [Dyadobacter sp. CY323]